MKLVCGTIFSCRMASWQQILSTSTYFKVKLFCSFAYVLTPCTLSLTLAQPDNLNTAHIRVSWVQGCVVNIPIAMACNGDYQFSFLEEQ